MTKRRKVWMYCPPRPKKLKVPDSVKSKVSLKAQQLIDEYLRPEHVKPPPKKPQFNYIIDLFTKWYQSYFYFCAVYACPHPDATSPTFETRFARMGYQGEDRFNLAYMRHNGKWNEIFFALTLDECLKAIKDEPHFLP
jgi:hypothetical protein